MELEFGTAECEGSAPDAIERDVVKLEERPERELTSEIIEERFRDIESS